MNSFCLTLTFPSTHVLMKNTFSLCITLHIKKQEWIIISRRISFKLQVGLNIIGLQQIFFHSIFFSVGPGVFSSLALTSSVISNTPRVCFFYQHRTVINIRTSRLVTYRVDEQFLLKQALSSLQCLMVWLYWGVCLQIEFNSNCRSSNKNNFLFYFIVQWLQTSVD